MPGNVVIIGAGAAGIAAARELTERGVRPTILEARSRIGGRAWTETATFGFPVDLGCSWLHSADLNPWTTYARHAGFTVRERSPQWQRRIGAAETTPEYQAAWLGAFRRNETLIAAAARAGRDVSVADVVPIDSFRPLFDCVMSWLMGVDTARMSAVDFDRYADSDRNWVVTEGLGSVVAHAARQLDVRLDTPVKTIDWTGRHVRLETSRGALEADAVIVTAPTNVLAEESIRFTPAAPALLEACLGVPLGTANKVFFEMAPGSLPYEGSVHFTGTDRSVRTASYQTRPLEREVLLAYFGGGLARELEERDELENFALDELASIFGASFPKQVRRTLHSGWTRDPWSRGAYSAALPGCAHLRSQLSEPLGDRVFFAGEACSLDYFGTINGASQTGVRAAAAVVRKLNEDDSSPLPSLL
ncbi:MAG: flavin monoamine oxidase family protein [Steroidobacter sp.]